MNWAPAQNERRELALLADFLAFFSLKNREAACEQPTIVPMKSALAYPQLFTRLIKLRI